MLKSSRYPAAPFRTPQRRSIILCGSRLAPFRSHSDAGDASCCRGPRCRGDRRACRVRLLSSAIGSRVDLELVRVVQRNVYVIDFEDCLCPTERLIAAVTATNSTPSETRKAASKICRHTSAPMDRTSSEAARTNAQRSIDSKLECAPTWRALDPSTPPFHSSIIAQGRLRSRWLA